MGYCLAIPSRMALAAASRAVFGSSPLTMAASATPNGPHTWPIAGMAGRIVPPSLAAWNLAMSGSVALTSSSAAVSAGRRGSAAYSAVWTSLLARKLVAKSWASVLCAPLLAR